MPSCQTKECPLNSKQAYLKNLLIIATVVSSNIYYVLLCSCQVLKPNCRISGDITVCIWNNGLGRKNCFIATSYINWSVFISCCFFLYRVNLVFTGTLLIGMTAGKVAFDKLPKSTLVISTKQFDILALFHDIYGYIL